MFAEIPKNRKLALENKFIANCKLTNGITVAPQRLVG